MPTAEQREDLRRKTGEADAETSFTDTMLDEYIDDANGDLDLAASVIWREKASTYAELVDISEAGSSRKDSVLYKNAVDQAEFYERSATGSAPVENYTTTRPITRL